MISSYTFDGNNLRQSKTVNGVVTNHIWDGMHIVAETRDDGNVFARYWRGLGGEPISATTNGTSFLYSFDSRGNVVDLLYGEWGSRLASYTFDAFGNPLQSAVSAVHNPFRYRGHGYHDSHTGFIYLRNRFYDPSIGRFLTEDPIRWGLNWYDYALQNPIRFIDPLGLAPNEVGLRDMIEWYGGGARNISVYDDRVVVNFRGRDPVTYYYNPNSTDRPQMHGNRMVDGRMMVCPVAFGQHFGLTRTVEDSGSGVANFSFWSANNLPSTGTLHYNWSFEVEYVRVPGGDRLVFRQSFELEMTSWSTHPPNWRGQPSASLPTVRPYIAAILATEDKRTARIDSQWQRHISNPRCPHNDTPARFRFANHDPHLLQRGDRVLFALHIIHDTINSRSNRLVEGVVTL